MKHRNPMKSSRKFRKGVVTVIAALFISSAALRVGIGAGEAIAQVESPAEDSVKTSSESASEYPSDSAKSPPNHAEMSILLEALQVREKKLKTNEQRLKMRSKALEVATREVEKRISDLEKIEGNLRKTLSLADGAAENDLAQLTSVYENMKPKDAAAIFESMAPPFAAGFLGRMRADSAAAILSGLTPELAYTISVILAGRNAKAPKT